MFLGHLIFSIIFFVYKVESGKIRKNFEQIFGDGWGINKSANRSLIQKWKNELNLNKRKIKKQFYDEKKRKFIERFDEFKELYGQGKQKEFVKELGISEGIFLKWKKELVPNYYKNKTHNKYSDEDKLQNMKQYFEIKEVNQKIGDKIIAKKLGIKYETMRKWKKKFAPKHLLDI